MTHLHKEANRRRLRPTAVVVAAAALGCSAILVTDGPTGWPPLAWHGLAVILLPVTLWASGAVPEYLPSLVLFFLAMVLGVAPAEVVFSGFLSQAAWLVFGGIVIGQAVQKTGLARQLVDLAMHRFSGGYGTLVVGLAATAFATAFFIPSAMGRAVLLTPLAVAIAGRFGHAPDSGGYTGIVLATVLGSTLPAFAILPANVPNLVMAGAAEQIWGVEFRYFEYALLNLPVMGLASIAIACALIVGFFRAESVKSSRTTGDAAPDAAGRVALSVILVATVVLWLLDSIHGVSPAWVALGAALACLAPWPGILKADEFIRTINLGPWLFVAGIVGLGAVAARIGIADLAAAQLQALIPQGGFGAFLSMVTLGVASSVLTNHPAAPALVTPLAGPLSEISGWPIESVLMVQVPGWIVFPFAYQVPPIVVALSLAKIPMSRAVRFFLVYFVVAAIVVLPLQYLWGLNLGVYR